MSTALSRLSYAPCGTGGFEPPTNGLTKYPQAHYPSKGIGGERCARVSRGTNPAGFVSPLDRSFQEVTARSLPLKWFSGRNQAKPPGPFQLGRLSGKLALVFAAGVRRRGTGIGWCEVSSPSLPGKSGRRDRICTCMSLRPRVSETRVSACCTTRRKNLVEEAGFAPAKVGDRRVYNALPLLLGYSSKLGADGGNCTPSGLAPTGISGRCVYWFRHIRKIV